MTELPKAPPSDAEEKKPPTHRTAGLKMFDVLLYPLFTNFGVFAISVAATYLTSHGGDKGQNGKLIYGKVGSFFHSRGEWLVGKFKKMGLSHNQADMSKMVFFSFADGTLLAPVVKLFEDNREKIARKIDAKLGTTPGDLSVYDAEPKQGWLSIIGGRFSTAAIVVPTAVALDKTGLNDRLFSNPGRKTGEWIAGKPNLAKYFGSLNLPSLSKVMFFEFFYTSVCTAGLYFSSRLFARMGEKKVKHEAKAEGDVTQTITPAPAEESGGRTHQSRLLAQYTQMETGRGGLGMG